MIFYRTLLILCTNIVKYIDKKSNTANIRALSEAIKNKQKVKLRLGLRAKNLLSRNMRENISSYTDKTNSVQKISGLCVL